MNSEIVVLIAQKNAIIEKLALFPYGAIEVREKGTKKYLYTHHRDSGRMVTNFVGEYTPELYDSIIRNTTRAKELKKTLKELEKKLAATGYEARVLSDKIKRNIDFAKRNLVDAIYDQAVLEGVATTFAETEDIINGAKVYDTSPRDVMKIVNLKHAWEFVLDESVIMAEHDLALLCQINKLVCEGFYYNAGKLRDVPAKISGTDWTPLMPFESTIKENLAKILDNHDAIIEVAIDLILMIMRSQIFIDGNKRTAIIFANHYLISKGKGIISIPVEHTDEFRNLLVRYYESGDKAAITDFLREKCYIKIDSV